MTTTAQNSSLNNYPDEHTSEYERLLNLMRQRLGLMHASTDYVVELTEGYLDTAENKKRYGVATTHGAINAIRLMLKDFEQELHIEMLIARNLKTKAETASKIQENFTPERMLRLVANNK